jgi:hypothetical protein
VQPGIKVCCLVLNGIPKANPFLLLVNVGHQTHHFSFLISTDGVGASLHFTKPKRDIVSMTPWTTSSDIIQEDANVVSLDFGRRSLFDGIRRPNGIVRDHYIHQVDRDTVGYSLGKYRRDSGMISALRQRKQWVENNPEIARITRGISIWLNVCSYRYGCVLMCL